jgi:hypothetical protein
VVACTSCCRDQGKNDKADHDQNLSTAEPELELSEEPNAEIVDSDNGSQEKRHKAGGPCSGVTMLSCFVEPELDDEN